MTGWLVHRVVLDPQFADAEFFRQAVGFDERGETDLQPDGRVIRHRQQFAVTPHRLRARGNRCFGQRLFDAVVVIGDFERAEVELADVIGRERIFASALPALQRLHVTTVFFHKIFRSGVSAERRNYFSVGGGLPTPLRFQGKQKAPAHG